MFKFGCSDSEGRTKTILGHNDFTAFYDKGYHAGSELAIADMPGIPAIVTIPPFSGASYAPDIRNDVEHFTTTRKLIPTLACKDTP
nr:hypothetical protein [uncultured Draconibacterium sp.]